MAFGRITRGEQRFFLNETEVNGVQSAQIGYNLGGQPTKFLGGLAGVDNHPVGGVDATARVDMLMMNVGDDPFYQFTGNRGFDGYIIKDSLDMRGDAAKGNASYNFSFKSGYLTSYSTSWALGGLPQISADIQIFNKAGRLAMGDIPSAIIGQNQTSARAIPDPGAVDITLMDDLSSNRLMSYSVSVSCQRSPKFFLGSRYASFINLVSPVVISCDFQIEVDDYLAYNVDSYPCDTVKKDLTINIKEKNTDNLLRTYSFPNLQLASENYQAGVNGNAVVNAKYAGYIPVQS
jgi:hypothetical protein